jgi:hypothetical protein
MDWYNEVLWGDTFEEIPELTMATLAESRANIHAHMDAGFPWYTIDVDADEIYLEYADIVKDEEKFKSDVSDAITDINEFIYNQMPNCIIAGTTKALVENEMDAKSLDEQEILHDNKTVTYVRQEIISLSKQVIEKFASRLVQSINNIEEI